MPELLKCPSCQGNLELYEETRATIKCHYCDSTVAVPEHLRAKPEPASKAETVFVSTTSFNVDNGRSLPSSVGCLIWIVVLTVIGVPLLLAAVNMPTVQQMLGVADGEPSQVEAAALAAANATRDAVETAVVISPFTPTPSPTPAFAEPVLVIGEKGTGRGQFENPRRLAVDNAGQVYVWDMDGRRVQVFDEAGSYRAQWPLDQAVRFLLADGQGHLYVLADELWRHDGASGQPLDQITVTTANGTISHFQTMAFTPQGNLVLSFWDHDQWIDYLLVIDREGMLLELWTGAMTNHYGQDGMAKQLAVDRQGHIYAFELQTILKFGPDGRFLNRVGSSGSGPGEWSAPQNIGVDGNGRLYIGEWRGIHVYDNNARFLDTIPTDAYVMDLALSDNNDIWAIVGEQLVRFTIQR
jgi:hypothetical protein